MKEENSKKGLKIGFIIAIVILIVVVLLDVLKSYIPLDDLFKSSSITNITKKEVTVTDEGIADAVDKVMDATVIVKVGTNGQYTGWGSGFVFKTDDKLAYILTNHHVVDEADIVSVIFTDQSTSEAKVLGSDEYSDVAVITVPKDKILSVAEIGASEDLRVGDTVFAVGTPVKLDYSFTVTRGILSGSNRIVEESNSNSNSNSIFGNYQNNTETWYTRLLQIDAAINGGNSGGPLCNSNGEVIGITSSKISTMFSSTSIENMGFAIPIEDAIEVADSLVQGKKITHDKIQFGVSMTTVEGAKANNIEIDSNLKTGAVIAEVLDNSIASKAGFKPGDVITEFDGKEIENYKYFKYYLFKHNSGDKVIIKYNRSGSEKEVTVTLKN